MEGLDLQDDTRREPVTEDEDYIVLADLSTDELVEQMHDDLYDGLLEEIEEGTTILLERGWPADRVLNEQFGRGIGADAYCRDASQSAEEGPRLIKARIESV